MFEGHSATTNSAKCDGNDCSNTVSESGGLTLQYSWSLDQMSTIIKNVTYAPLNHLMVHSYTNIRIYYMHFKIHRLLLMVYTCCIFYLRMTIICRYILLI